MEEGKVGKTRWEQNWLYWRLPVNDRIDRAISGSKIQNPGSFGSRGRTDEEILSWEDSLRIDRTTVHQKQWRAKEDAHSANNSCYPKLLFQILTLKWSRTRGEGIISGFFQPLKQPWAWKAQENAIELLHYELWFFFHQSTAFFFPQSLSTFFSSPSWCLLLEWASVAHQLQSLWVWARAALFCLHRLSILDA